MMCKIIENSKGHLFRNTKVLLFKNYSCETYLGQELITRPSISKVDFESLSFLQRIQGVICGPIHPTSGLFRYFLVLVDISTRWSHVCLLSTSGVIFARLLA